MNKHSKNNSFFYIFLASIALFAALLRSKERTETTQITSLSPAQMITAQHFIDKAESNVQYAWHELEKHMGLTLDKCKNFINKFEVDFIETSNVFTQEASTKKPRPISQETRILIEEVCTDFNIPKESLPVIPFTECAAAVDDYKLYIEEIEFSSYSTNTQRFLIAHELTHYKNSDTSIMTALNSYYEAYKKDLAEQHLDIEEAESLAQEFITKINQMSYAVELRADIYAMLFSPEYAQGAIVFFEEVIERYGDIGMDTHPKPSKRLKLAQEIHTMHTNTQA